MAHALEVIGERWALLIVRELLLGPKRFTDLRAGMPDASPDVLAQRLRELKDAGVVRQATLPPPAGSKVCELTDWGMELEPLVTHLGQWGSRSLSLGHDAYRSIDSLVLSLRALFNPAAAKGFSATIGLRLGENVFSVKVGGGQLHLARGKADRPTATIDTDPLTLAALLYGGRALNEGCAPVK
ncbi:MAG: putative transcriptional regulator [Mycobacterium sp.]|nr:putative transcriptional regulator [Mycobacterium sp.]